ncbi:MAG: class I SAM-dependent methyltransferase [Microcoleaceae cyanobacterium]
MAVSIRPNRFQPGVLNTIYRNLGYAVRQQTTDYSELSDFEPLTEKYLQIFQHHLTVPERSSLVASSSFISTSAIDSFQAIGLDIFEPQFHSSLGEALAQRKQFEAAILFYKIAAKVQPKNVEIQTQLQAIFTQQQEFQKDLAGYYTEIEKYPDRPMPYRAIGNILTDYGRPQEALPYHQQSLKLKGWDTSTQGYQFTRDWFSPNISIWIKYLQEFVGKPGVNFLEIGSFEGMSTCWFLEHILTHPTAQMTCIDPYFRPEFNRNLSRTEAAEKITKRVGYSQDVLKTLQPNSYSLVYIDGCHLASVALQDTLLSWPLFKIGGMIVFDDYNVVEEDNPEQTAKVGIDQFLQRVESTIDILYQGYQLIIRKRATALTAEEIVEWLSQIPQYDQLRW